MRTDQRAATTGDRWPHAAHASAHVPVWHQIAVVEQTLDDVVSSFRVASARPTRGLARLAFAWSVLERMLEIASATSSASIAAWWARPGLKKLRMRLRDTLRDGVVYSQASFWLVAQLYRMAVKLAAHEARRLRPAPTSSPPTQ